MASPARASTYTDGMARLRHVLLAAALAAAVSACGTPPDKEMQQAQGAIDAAKAVDADRYARDEYTAARDALRKANQAVAERDYRQALNYALDSRERAEAAAKEATENRAAARRDAEKALSDASAALKDAQQHLKAAETGRAASKTIAGPRKAVVDGGNQVQKARAAFEGGDYPAVTDAAHAAAVRLRAAAHDLEGAAKAPPPRSGRRRH